MARLNTRARFTILLVVVAVLLVSTLFVTRDEDGAFHLDFSATASSHRDGPLSPLELNLILEDNAGALPWSGYKRGSGGRSTGLKLKRPHFSPVVNGKPNRGSNDTAKMDHVRAMMNHSWTGYRTYAWGSDELRPISKGSKNWYHQHSLLSTPIDALDTLWLMGMRAEYEDAKELVMSKLDISNVEKPINLFETTIRIVGGLIGAYEMDHDEEWIRKAKGVLDPLMVAFNATPTRIPLNYVAVGKGVAVDFDGGKNIILLSEAGTLQLEMQYLSDVTGDPRYSEYSLFVLEQLENMGWPTKGLFGKRFDPNRLRVLDNTSGDQTPVFSYGLGGETDSFYEYLLKLYISTGEKKFLERFERSAEVKPLMIATFPIINFHCLQCQAMEQHMLKSIPPNMFYLPDTGCFAGGMFSLSSFVVERSNATRMFEIGKGITETCAAAYEHSAVGLGPESFMTGGSWQPYHDYYILRPEFVESLFYMWRFTHDPIYRERGWKVVQALDKHCKTAVGYASLASVRAGQQDDKMESFFYAETLKYLFLLFAEDDVLPLEHYVLNTEAHPLSIRGKGMRANRKTMLPIPIAPENFKHKVGVKYPVYPK
ncbi:hypothetical protein HK101_004303 [Irineochytrium annulatum]|nr:hypothetical protein HK101_004303 [Irineochytrium annulatum]